MDIGEFLKDTREAANLTLPELAELTGTPKSTLTAYERGSRTPRVDQLDEIFAGLGLQLRFEVEPLWAEVDAAIEEAQRAPMAERLARLANMRVEPLPLLAELDLPCVLEGMCAAALLGAPVPVAAVDLVLPVDDDVLERFTQWAERHARRWSARWNVFAYAVADPRLGKDPLRYETNYGELRLRLADPLPESITVHVGDQTVQVLDLRRVKAADPISGRVLQRMQQRLGDG